MNGSNRPYHFEIPSTYQVKKSLSGFTLYLNINSYNIIKGLFFTGTADSPWLPAFSELCHLCEGKRLSDDFLNSIRLDSPSKWWNLPLWLLRAASREFFQTLPPHDRLTGRQAEDLICRCFGVYLSQIHPLESLKEVTDQTQAGGGCTRCRGHIEDIVGINFSTPSLISEHDFDKIQKLTTVFIRQNYPSATLKFTGIRGNRIQVLFSGEQHKKDKILQSVETLLAHNFQPKIFLDCTH